MSLPLNAVVSVAVAWFLGAWWGYASWGRWHRRRNLPAHVRALGPPHTIKVMNAIGDMLDPAYPLTTDRGQLLAEALELIKRAARDDE